MLKIEIIKKFDEVQISSFLENVKCNKFNLFPKVHEINVKQYLLEQIKNSVENDKVFICTNKTDIVVLITLRKLDWDSKHFGYKCAIIDNILFDKESDYHSLKNAFEIIIDELIKQEKQNKTKFISISIDSWDSVLSSVLQAKDFKYILTWINGVNSTKDRLPLNYKENEIGLMVDSELNYYKKIASSYYFEGGRFYFDHNFDVSLVKKMYSNLISTSYDNKDIMLSYRIKGNPIGLFVCNKIKAYKQFNNLRVAPLRYLVIAPEARQKHIGYDLFAATMNYLMEQSDIITTGLEVHNLPSLNLHSKLKFKFNYVHNVYHLWLK